MTYRAARKLHNEDEVISKETGESIRVLHVKDHPKQGEGTRGCAVIVGLGKLTGYHEWVHVEVR